MVEFDAVQKARTFRIRSPKVLMVTGSDHAKKTKKGKAPEKKKSAVQTADKQTMTAIPSETTKSKATKENRTGKGAAARPKLCAGLKDSNVRYSKELAKLRVIRHNERTKYELKLKVMKEYIDQLEQEKLEDEMMGFSDNHADNSNRLRQSNVDLARELAQVRVSKRHLERKVSELVIGSDLDDSDDLALKETNINEMTERNRYDEQFQELLEAPSKQRKLA